MGISLVGPIPVYRPCSFYVRSLAMCTVFTIRKQEKQKQKENQKNIERVNFSTYLWIPCINTYRVSVQLQYLNYSLPVPWWRHQIEIFSALLLSKQSWRQRFETTSRSLWRHCNAESIVNIVCSVKAHSKPTAHSGVTVLAAITIKREGILCTKL